ncbi:hypothetical protein H5410_063983, partial [Solanum commersonii]
RIYLAKPSISPGLAAPEVLRRLQPATSSGARQLCPAANARWRLAPSILKAELIGSAFTSNRLSGRSRCSAVHRRGSLVRPLHALRFYARIDFAPLYVRTQPSPCLKAGQIESLSEPGVRACLEMRSFRGRAAVSPCRGAGCVRGVSRSQGFGRPDGQGPRRVDRRTRLRRRSTSGQGASPGPNPAFPPEQFQALFDSLFKVLFIFPSRYLLRYRSRPYLALGRIHARFGLHSQTTELRKRRLRGAAGSNCGDSHPLGAPSGDLGGPPVRALLGLLESRAPRRSRDSERRASTTTCAASVGVDSHLGQPRARAPGGQLPPAPAPCGVASGSDRVAPERACPRPNGRAQLAFKDFDGSADYAIHTKYRI